MAKRFQILLLIIFGFSISQNLKGQCHIDVTLPTTDTTICLGDSVRLMSDGSCTFLMQNRFLDGTIGTGWSSMGANPVFTNPCGIGLDSIYLWVGATSATFRSVETTDFDVSSTSCMIQWYMRYGAQPNNGPCEDPDTPQEGVNLQYSTNGGGTWTDFPGVNQYPQGQNFYTDHGGPPGDDFIGVTTTPGTGGQWHPHGHVTTTMYNQLPGGTAATWMYLYWHEYENSIPPTAATSSTRFRWIQLANSGQGWDAWGIDHVEIYCPGHQNVAWSHGVQAFDGGWVSPTSDETYTVFILDTSGHSASANVTITVLPPLDPGLGPDTTICDFPGNYAILEADTGFDAYQWNTGETTRTIQVDTSGTYSVIVTKAGCTGTDSVNVTITPAPTADAGPDQEICIGDSVTLTAAPVTGFYAWSTGDSTQSITVSPQQDSTYYLTVGTTLDCMAYDTVHVTVHPLPNADAGPDQEICDGDDANLSASGGQIYEWSTGDMVADITVSPSTTTEYMVTVTDAHGCVNYDTTEVTVFPLPQVTAWAADSAICMGDETEVYADGATTYDWGHFTGSPVTVSPMETTKYTVTGTDDNGCSNTASVTVVAEDCSSFYIPNAFNPEGGINTVFMPVGDFTAVTEYEMTIYDRWGNVVFNTGDPHEGWDGTIDGEPAPKGVYVYHVTYSSRFGKDFEMRGTVTLLR